MQWSNEINLFFPMAFSFLKFNSETASALHLLYQLLSPKNFILSLVMLVFSVLLLF